MEKFSYENTILEIESLLEKLEDSDVSLDIHIKNFKKAEELIEKCEKYLDSVEKEVELIIERESNQEEVEEVIAPDTKDDEEEGSNFENYTLFEN